MGTNPPLPHPSGPSARLSVLLDSAHPPSTRSVLSEDRSLARSSAQVLERRRAELEGEQRTRTRQEGRREHRPLYGHTFLMGIQGATATQTATAVHGALAEMHKRSLAQPRLHMAAQQQSQTPVHSLSIPRDTHRNQRPQGQPTQLLATSQLLPATDTD